MAEHLLNEKKGLRREMLRLRNLITENEKRQLDYCLCRQLIEKLGDRDIKTVHCYLPIGSEVNLIPFVEFMLANGIQVVCPKTLPNRLLENRILVSLNELTEGVMKTFYPSSPAIFDGPYDLIIVPGLAYDSYNFRVGYGGGYYDAFLAQQEQALKVGVFYDFQKVNVIATESHDLALDQILTPQ